MSRPTGNLLSRLQVVQHAVKQLPAVAARAAQEILAQDEERQRAPDGTRWARTKEGKPFDQGHSIQYTVQLRPEGVVLESEHRAAALTRWGTRNMQARPKVPGKGGAAAWAPRILKALRRWRAA